MFNNIKKDLQALKESEPGYRFQDRYYRRKKRKKGNGRIGRFFTIITGLSIIAVGMIFLLIPGSGWAIIIIGTGIIAGESLLLAKILDVLELIIRKLFGKQRTS